MDGSEMMVLDGYEADDFVGLAELYLQHGIEIGALATAIEAGGVWGWDRYGRFVHGSMGTQVAQAALDRLARQYEREASTYDDDEDLDPTSDPLYFHGWLYKDLPRFSPQDRQRPAAPIRQGDLTRASNGLLTQIGALVEVVLGQGVWRDAARFSNQSKLIEALSDHYEGMQSMSKRTLESSFAKARKALDKP